METGFSSLLPENMCSSRNDHGSVSSGTVVLLWNDLVMIDFRLETRFEQMFEGLEGLALKLVQGDQNDRNWMEIDRKLQKMETTIARAKSIQESKKLVFHVLTDQQNYFAIKLWFSRNTFEEAAKSKHQLSLTEEFRISFQNDLSRVSVQTIYLSLCMHRI